MSTTDPLISIAGESARSRTPLKSLLKKQSIDVEEYPEPQCVSDSEVDGRESPKKSVHFSEIDQVRTVQLILSTLNVCYSTVTCKVLLNRPQCKLGQLCTTIQAGWLIGKSSAWYSEGPGFKSRHGRDIYYKNKLSHRLVMCLSRLGRTTDANLLFSLSS